MSPQRTDLLDPYELAQLGGIELTARGVAEGYMTGLHRSPFHGFSVEFTENRPYQPGDEIRYIDWKMMGRSDRLFVKQYAEETNLRSMIVLDASRSMDWAGAEQRLTKLEYSKRLSAALAHVLLMQRDATGYVAFDDDVRTVIPARSRRQQWNVIVRSISETFPGEGTAAAPALRRVTDFLKRRGLVLFISDLLLDPEATLTALQFLRHRGHNVVVFHIMDPAERDLEGPPEARFLDTELGDSVVARPRELRKAYRQTVEKTVTRWRSSCDAIGASYQLVETTTPFGFVLRSVAAQASKVTR